jgi:hypothetical protein
MLIVASSIETGAMIVVWRAVKEALVASSEDNLSKGKGSLILYVSTE